MAMEQRRNSNELYNPMTLIDAQIKFPYLNWTDYLNQLFPPNISISENETVIFNSLQFFNRFNDLLETTTNRTIANYLLWRITEFSAYYLNSEIRKRQLAYNTVAIGTKEFSARWKECISITNNKLSTAAGALYIRKYFHAEAKHTAAQMVEQIRMEFKEVLKLNTWMDEKTKLAANKKVDAIISHIGYPDELNDDQKLDNYYKPLQMNRTNYLASILNINKFYMFYEFESLRKPVNKTDWILHSSPTFINAFYSFEENSIGKINENFFNGNFSKRNGFKDVDRFILSILELPAGILQGIFFSADRPLYLNFGGIGFIIGKMKLLLLPFLFIVRISSFFSGHELTHGFDDEGRQYDQKGDLSNWWDNATEVHFLQRAKCMIDQYSNFTEPLTNLSVRSANIFNTEVVS